uniref:Transmembrane protein n=1 Tax=Pithovirus LCPAC101 TaxID=2506586 RepID=A0A481Z5I5_9VIRU|nr:MAG: hypothetical protein LCPAC101_02030 [Pithovirus LCPAC101]
MEKYLHNHYDSIDKRFHNNIIADTKSLSGFSPVSSSDFESTLSADLLQDFHDKDEGYNTVLIKQDMITRYDKRIDLNHEDDIGDDIIYYYTIKCWNPFKYCDTPKENIQCMNVICKSLCVILFIILISVAIVFILHDMFDM